MQAITFQRLNIFLTVCQAGSFNKAAELLFMSQAAVSQHVQTFEAAVGEKLFERSAKGVTPTPAGKTLLRYAEKILPLVAEAERAVINIAQLKDEGLNIGATPGLSVYVLPQLSRRFQEAYPNINLSIQTSLTIESIAKVLNRRFDFGFVEGHLVDLDLELLEIIDLAPIDYLLVVPDGHRWATAKTIEPKALETEPFLHRQPTSRSRRWMEFELARLGVELKQIAAELDSPGAIKYSLFNRLGVSILPDYAVEREVKSGELVEVKIKGVSMVRPMKLIWQKGRILGPVQQAFLEINR